MCLQDEEECLAAAPQDSWKRKRDGNIFFSFPSQIHFRPGWSCDPFFFIFGTSAPGGNGVYVDFSTCVCVCRVCASTFELARRKRVNFARCDDAKSRKGSQTFSARKNSYKYLYLSAIRIWCNKEKPRRSTGSQTESSTLKKNLFLFSWRCVRPAILCAFILSKKIVELIKLSNRINQLIQEFLS